ncbi:MAG: hydrogenase expression/formation C-terminal domain-containing protein [Sphingobium sp.]|nr:hydrogenase expression/formation C-terminal domain-containing protein [Sphingobium sp.]
MVCSCFTHGKQPMKEWVEVAAFPPSLLAVAFQDATDELPIEREFPENVFNAPPLIPEINEHLPKIAGGELTNHVINLSLLPHTPEDLTYLDAILGKRTAWSSPVARLWQLPHPVHRHAQLLVGAIL